MEKIGIINELFEEIKDRKLTVFKTQKSLEYDLSIESPPIYSSSSLKLTLTISNHTNSSKTFCQTYPDIHLPLLNCTYLFP